MANKRFEKELFTSVKLSVSRHYLQPPGRGRLYLVGALMAFAVVTPFVIDAFWGGARVVASGALSESHVLFGEEDCATCHTPFQAVSNTKCESCHAKTGAPLAQYGYERHYLYHSAEADRSAPGTLETPCASCHREHEGEDAPLQRVADAQCQTCHTYEAFDLDHPEFAFASAGEPDRANLAFPHVFHVREVAIKEELDDFEDACLYCHVPDENGMSFQPLSFERQCDGCHFNNNTATPRLPIRTANTPGVLTLDAIRANFSPAELWAAYADPNEFEVLGGTVRKRPVYHADPWIMENLARIRAELYPGAELAQLLQSSAELASGIGSVVHEEAVATLRSGIRALRGHPSPDVQDVLDALTGVLDQVESKLDNPYAPLDETRFFVRSGDEIGGIVAEGRVDAEAVEAVLDGLTASCQSCHIVSQAEIVRVQKDQRTLIRSEFDHGAHIIHKRCLDCHTRIPIRRYMGMEEDPDPSLDRAGIQNLPTIESCVSCHSDRGASDRCTSCHLFHPDKSQRSNLSRAYR